jgi:hypothetical protein
MIRRTYGDVLPELARYAGVSAMPTTDARVLTYLNLVTEELMNEGDFPTLIDRYKFQVYNSNITLPGMYERILNMTINHVPQTMQSPWYELVGFGPTPAAEQVLDQQQLTEEAFDTLRRGAGVMDRRDVCTFADIPNPNDGTLYTLLLATTTDERINSVQPTGIVIQGYDGNGNWIRTNNNGTYIDGVMFNWVQGGPFQQASSTQDFTQITAVIKPEYNGPVNCYTVPIGGGPASQIARWEAREQRPSYRRYHVPLLNQLVNSMPSVPHVVVCSIRRRFVPIEQLNDELPISNLPALKAMYLALNYQEKNDMDNYLKHKTVAVELLKKEADRYTGPQRRKPLITFADGAAVRQNTLYVL